MKVAYITAITGAYEATCKKFPKQTVDSDFICFTDCENIESNGWEIDTREYHYEFPSDVDNNKYKNSLCNNKHTFNIAKYYKQQFHNIPRLKSYNVVVWVDGTVSVKNNNTSKDLIAHMDEGNLLITCEHRKHRRSLKKEAEMSVSKRLRKPKYASTHWNGQDQPYQDTIEQYEQYVKNGYTEQYWVNVKPRNRYYGVFVTCFAGWDMRNEKTRQFLDMWYKQTLQHTTQDQVGFAYVAQKMNIHPYTAMFNGQSGYYWSGAPHNNYFEKIAHGQ